MKMTVELHSKAAFRTNARDALMAMTEDERILASETIQRLIIETEEYRSSSCVMLYSPYGAEVSTSELLSNALESEKRIFLPVFRDSEYLPGEYTPDTELVRGKYGILEPTHGVCASYPEKLFVIAPGLAFDRNGHRLGKGLGYYDRMLTSLTAAGTLCFCAGLVYASNLYPFIPHDETDFDVDVVVTENELVRCASTKAGASFK